MGYPNASWRSIKQIAYFSHHWIDQLYRGMGKTRLDNLMHDLAKFLVDKFAVRNTFKL